MLIETLRRCILRDLDTLADELGAYPDDATVWALPTGAPNSAGTLTLHIAGNLRHFIGATLGGNGYLRDREDEFGRRGTPRVELLALIVEARGEIDEALRALDPTRLDEIFPLAIGETRLPTDRFLVHLAIHLGYHLGQVDYHRRLVTGDGTSVGAMGVAAIG